MTYNAETRTSTVDGSIETPPLDMALHMVHVLADMYKDPNQSPAVRKDTEDLYRWLGQDVGVLTPTSTEKFRTAYLAYLSIGVSPNFSSQPLFDMIHALPEVKERIKLKPPTEIMDIFDRMIATDEEISKKRSHDYSIERKKIEKTFGLLKNKPKTVDQVKEKFESFSEKTKIFLVVTVCWFLWVIIRTSTYFELLGHDFDQWDEDMFLQNFLVVPVVLIVGNFLYNRYIKDKKKN